MKSIPPRGEPIADRCRFAEGWDEDEPTETEAPLTMEELLRGQAAGEPAQKRAATKR